MRAFYICRRPMLVGRPPVPRPEGRAGFPRGAREGGAPREPALASFVLPSRWAFPLGPENLARRTAFS
jgi:hypothetical protein